MRKGRDRKTKRRTAGQGNAGLGARMVAQAVSLRGKPWHMAPPQPEDLRTMVLDKLLAYNKIGLIWLEGRLDADTELYGKAGVLHSVALVSLIMDLEDEILTRYGKVVVIGDQKIFSRAQSPFKNVSLLSNYLIELIDHG